MGALLQLRERAGRGLTSGHPPPPPQLTSSPGGLASRWREFRAQAACTSRQTGGRAESRRAQRSAQRRRSLRADGRGAGAEGMGRGAPHRLVVSTGRAGVGGETERRGKPTPVSREGGGWVGKGPESQARPGACPKALPHVALGAGLLTAPEAAQPREVAARAWLPAAFLLWKPLPPNKGGPG